MDTGAHIIRYPGARTLVLAIIGALWTISIGTGSASGRVRPAPVPAAASASGSAAAPASGSLLAWALVVPLVAAPRPRVEYHSPVWPLTVVRGFTPGITRYSAGHRGVDLVLSPPATITAAADGVVSFAGAVAGRGIVVVAHPDGIRTTYEPVHPLVTVGQRVGRGQLIATGLGAHPGCVETCLHWGARRGEVYLDPLVLLRPLGPIRLLP